LELASLDGVAWDTEATRRRLQEAATEEFAQYGPDGTTMARIAARAGINKERLYNYFGDKQALFETVLNTELQKLAEAVGRTGAGYDDIGEFAGHTYDYYAGHPDLARLLQWEGLTGGPPADEKNRTAHYQRKIASVAAAQRAGTLRDDLPADHLVFLLIALSAWWFSVPQLALMITGADPSDPAEQARRRASVVQAAREFAAPR
jgi:AcrR family transcriptional regulator